MPTPRSALLYFCFRNTDEDATDEWRTGRVTESTLPHDEVRKSEIGSHFDSLSPSSLLVMLVLRVSSTLGSRLLPAAAVAGATVPLQPDASDCSTAWDEEICRRKLARVTAPVLQTRSPPTPHRPPS